MKKLLLAAALLAMTMPAIAQVNAPIPVKLAALTNTAVVAKSAPGILQWQSCANANAATVFIQYYDTLGAVTVGTTPAYAFIPVAAGAATLVPQMQFINGIKAAVTTTPGGSTAPATALDCSVGIN